jgi:hypothetical protein
MLKKKKKKCCSENYIFFLYTKGQRKRPFRPAALKYWFLLFCVFVCSGNFRHRSSPPFLPFHCLVSPNSFRDPVSIKLTNKSEERKQREKKREEEIGRVRETESTCRSLCRLAEGWTRVGLNES